MKPLCCQHQFTILHCVTSSRTELAAGGKAEGALSEAVDAEKSGAAMQRKSSCGQEVFWDAKELALPVYGNILPRNAPQLAGPEPAEPLVRHLV